MKGNYHSGRGPTSTRGKFHATSPLLITSYAADDETTVYYFTDCFRLGGSSALRRQASASWTMILWMPRCNDRSSARTAFTPDSPPISPFNEFTAVTVTGDRHWVFRLRLVGYQWPPYNEGVKIRIIKYHIIFLRDTILLFQYYDSVLLIQ